MPIKVAITIVLTLAFGCAVGVLVFGICSSIAERHDEWHLWVAGGSTLLGVTATAIVIHLRDGFRDLYRDETHFD